MNPKQATFVREYLVDLNATQAAIRAGYSAKTAEQQGPRLLGHVEVAAAIKAGMAARAARLDLKADDVLTDIARIAKAAELAGEYGAALKGRELLGKHLKLFTDKVEHSGDATLTVIVQSLAEVKK